MQHDKKLGTMKLKMLSCQGGITGQAFWSLFWWVGQMSNLFFIPCRTCYFLWTKMVILSLIFRKGSFEYSHAQKNTDGPLKYVIINLPCYAFFAKMVCIPKRIKWHENFLTEWHWFVILSVTLETVKPFVYAFVLVVPWLGRRWIGSN
jgi:hypothetical protein